MSLHTKNHFKASGALIYGLWCLMLFSTIFQLYRGSLFYWWSKPENPEKKTDRSQITDNLYHVMLHRKHPTISGIRTHNFSALISDKPFGLCNGLVCLPWLWSIIDLSPSRIKPKTIKLVFAVSPHCKHH